eukprot:PhM_4_TR18656/c0_g2_i2/m.75819
MLFSVLIARFQQLVEVPVEELVLVAVIVTENVRFRLVVLILMRKFQDLRRLFHAVIVHDERVHQQLACGGTFLRITLEAQFHEAKGKLGDLVHGNRWNEIWACFPAPNEENLGAVVLWEEWKSSRQELHHHDAEAPNVGLLDRFPSSLFRGHIQGGACDTSPLLRVVILQSGAKVRELCLSVDRQQNVLGLDVAVYDVHVVVKVSEALEDVPCVPLDNGRGQGMELLRDTLQGAARDILHDDDDVVADDAAGVKRNNAVVLDATQVLHLGHVLLHLSVERSWAVAIASLLGKNSPRRRGGAVDRGMLSCPCDLHCLDRDGNAARCV